ncbi:peptide-methionine (S)-S-oxide reductase MsrA [Methanosalsum natronophilum]|uniref:peptide-methionine (S)-S-oxide reductase MsrA n=1 Tax=Methanosalsum natronophilum TaxID=768733 RepID=UPI00286E8933|nr:peptide-methionine (S)-S-oxide reductase MsrA [Methanosalsum natronophilum]
MDGRDPIVKKATFAAGCFWGIENAFRKIKGVKSVLSGYTGGDIPDPKYKDVIKGKTDHVEAVQVTYDPSEIDYSKLIEEFWKLHDSKYSGCLVAPLTKDQPQFGRHYQSIIFYHDDDQKEVATKALRDQEKSGKYDSELTTQILPAKKFYAAEEYHQNFFQKQGYEDI